MSIENNSGLIHRFSDFFVRGLWRLNEDEFNPVVRFFVRLLKILVHSVGGLWDSRLQYQAASMTYYTALSIVPILAVIVAVSTGFGYKALLESQLVEIFPAQVELIDQGLVWADLYLSAFNNDLFVGLGILFLVYTIYVLISAIETNFNRIWKVREERPFVRKLKDYSALMIIVPLLITFSSGMQVFASTLFDKLNEFYFFSPITKWIIRITPYLLTSLLFALLFIFVPNTQVRVRGAIYSAIVTAIAFQFFQWLYITGQIYVTRYNAIYGSFAAIPLLLIWINFSWLIILYGAELNYSIQNHQMFFFEDKVRKSSRRYWDFCSVILASIVVKHFERGDKLLTAEELSEESTIPLRLTHMVLRRLVRVGVLSRTTHPTKKFIELYQPMTSAQLMSVGYLLQHLDETGKEKFNPDTDTKFAYEWRILAQSRQYMFNKTSKIFLKDL